MNPKKISEFNSMTALSSRTIFYFYTKSMTDFYEKPTTKVINISIVDLFTPINNALHSINYLYFLRHFVRKNAASDVVMMAAVDILLTRFL